AVHASLAVRAPAPQGAFVLIWPPNALTRAPPVLRPAPPVLPGAAGFSGVPLARVDEGDEGLQPARAQESLGGQGTRVAVTLLESFRLGPGLKGLLAFPQGQYHVGRVGPVGLEHHGPDEAGHL